MGEAKQENKKEISSASSQPENFPKPSSAKPQQSNAPSQAPPENLQPPNSPAQIPSADLQPIKAPPPKEPTPAFIKKIEKINKENPCLIHDISSCVRCGRCAIACQKIQGLSPMEFEEGSHRWKFCPTISHSENAAFCVYCGQCILACPNGSIKEKEHINEVRAAISDPSKIVIAQTAPAVRASLGETQGMPAGSLITGKMVAALRRLGFDKVMDTAFAADLTIMEEGNEFIGRLEKNENLPLITSCCPAWVRYAEKFFPQMLPNLSSCKSPHQMFGAIAKTYYAKKSNLDPKNIVVVSIMPCIAKKFECSRPEMNSSGYKDVDYVLTTRELGKMLKEANIELRALPDEFFDHAMGAASGAGTIFGASGGVMEAALRTVADKLDTAELPKIDYEQVRGMDGTRTATIEINSKKINVAVVHGLKNAKALLEKVQSGEQKLHFIEIMACPGGCIAGGGQPIPTNPEIVKKRAAALYHQDLILPLRKSHKNPEIIALYNEFLQTPGSEKAHKLLHTIYAKREN
ncbi:MAG: [FeFe] hydrogenase, group A [Candidatus Micrarchaeota archaeon]